MELVYVTATLLLLANVLVGLIRIIRGPSPADRMLSAQLFGTTGVAILLLLAQAKQSPAFRDVALVLAVLAVVAVVAFVRTVWRPANRAAART